MFQAEEAGCAKAQERRSGTSEKFVAVKDECVADDHYVLTVQGPVVLCTFLPVLVASLIHKSKFV